MLVLGRNRGQKVIVQLDNGEIISISVVEVRGTKVRLGFDAPGSVCINREEIYIANKEESK